MKVQITVIEFSVGCFHKRSILRDQSLLETHIKSHILSLSLT